MKQIGFINTPLSSAHAVRGVGFYTKNLLQGLHQYAAKFDFQISEISQPKPGFDLIHYPYFDLFYHSLPFNKVSKTVVTIHDVVPLSLQSHYPPGLRGWLNLQLQKMSLRSVSGVLTDSFASLNEIHHHLGVPHHKLKLVYLAASDIYRPQKKSSIIQKKYNLPDSFILYVGDVNWNKNLNTLIRSCLSQKIELVIVGKQAAQILSLDLSHPELAHLKEIIPSLSSPLIHTLGFVPDNDLVDIYNLATAYCQASYAEGFGLPVLEAMASGTPVILSNIGPLKEIAADSAVYFDPHNPDQLPKVLNELISDPTLRKKLSQAGLDRSSQFSWEKAAKDTLLSYKNFL